MSEHDSKEEFSFKNYFVPFTTTKAIHWIVVIGFVVFGNMFFNHFVWDDKSYVILNTDIHTFNFLKIIGTNLFNSAGQYRPISVTYFTLLYGLFNNTPFFYHFIQLVLH